METLLCSRKCWWERIWMKIIDGAVKSFVRFLKQFKNESFHIGKYTIKVSTFLKTFLFHQLLILKKNLSNVDFYFGLHFNCVPHHKVIIICRPKSNMIVIFHLFTRKGTQITMCCFSKNHFNEVFSQWGP